MLVSVVTALLGAAAVVLTAVFVRVAVPAEFAWLRAWTPHHVYTLLGLEIGAVRTVFEGTAFVLGFGAAALLARSALDRERLGAWPALGGAARRLPDLVAVYVGLGVVAIGLSVVSVPLALLAPVGLLAATAGAVLWVGRPGRRPLARWLVALGVPFGLLLEWAVRFVLALPAAAVGDERALRSFATSRRLVQGRWWPVAAVLAVTALTLVLVTLATGAVAALVTALFRPAATSLPGLGSASTVLVSVLVSQVPAVALTVLYLVLSGHPGAAALAAAHPRRSHRAPHPRPALMKARLLAISSLVALIGSALFPASSSTAYAAAPASTAATAARKASPAASPAPAPTPIRARSATLCGAGPPAPAAPAAHPAIAGSYVVTTLTDCVTGSLRDAVTQANTAGGPATITFAVSGTNVLTQPLSLTVDATIDGSGQTVVISGNDAVPVLTTSFNTVTISNLTIAHGLAATGSGLAGGFTSGGGSATFTNVTFDSNHGDAAGGLLNRGLTTITASTFTGNGAGNGGGALTAAESAVVTNSTFVNNGGPAATGGAIDVTGSLNANGITVVESTGGGISWLSGSLTLSNSFLQGNGNGDCVGFGTPAGSGNDDSDGSCGGGSHALPGDYAQNLGSNGGSTQTIALLPGSSAIGAGGTSCPATDQRGVARPSSGCDAGAYQFQPAVTIVLTTSQSAYNLGDVVGLTATVTPVYETAAAPGTVSFYDGATLLGSAALSGGAAGFGTSSLGIGPHTLTAVYSGETHGYAAATSSGVTVTILGSASTITVNGAPNPSTWDGAVTFTATLASGAPGSATGTITFYDGATVLDIQPVASDTASTTTSALTIGHHQVTAAYSGDSSHQAATSAAFDEDVRAPTATTATAASPAVYGTAAVQVTVTGGATTPTGLVQCLFPTGSASTGLDSAGHATCSLALAGPGAGTVTVTSNGDDGHAGSSTTVALTITAAPTSQVLTADVGSPVFGQPVHLTATVTAGGTPAIPAGTIDFVGSGVTLATVALDGTGAATTTVSPALGTTAYTSVYHPSTGFAAAANGSLVVSVTAAPTSTQLAASAAGVVTGQAVTLTATVSAGGGSAASPTGSVLFSDGAGFSQAVPLAAAGAGQAAAALSTSTLPLGAHSIFATYQPGTGFSVSASAPAAVTVSAASTTTSLVASPVSPSAFGQPVTLTAHVVAVAPGAGIPTGTVDFYDGATLLGSPAVDGTGAASIVLSLPATGPHTWSATYAGTSAYLGSSAAGVTYTVAAEATQLTASVSGTPLYGSPVTITAHVTSFDGTPVTGPVTVQAVPSGAAIGTAPLDGSGNASITSSAIPGDTTQVLVVFNATTDFAASGTTVNLPMSRATPTIQLAASPDPSVYFGNVTFTVTLHGVSPSDIPQGFVTPYLDGTPLYPVAVDAAGTAVVTVAAPLPYSHNLTAAYAGNTNYAPVSAYAGGFIYFTTNPANPGLSLSSSPDPAGTGLPFTLTAQATPINGVMPQGSVQFFANGILLGTAAVAPDGSASLATSWPVAATLNLQATFTSANGEFGTGTATRTLVVGQLATTTTAGINSPFPWLAGRPLTLAAYVHSPLTVNAGAVFFYDGASLLGSTSVASDGTAQLAVSGFSAGAHDITARYAGATGYAPSTSAIYAANISAHPTTVTVALSPSPPLVGQSTGITVTTAAADGATQFPTGTVTLTSGSQTCTTSAPVGGCAMTWAAAGMQTITAAYGGDSLFAPVTSTTSVDVVRQPPYLSTYVDPTVRWVQQSTVTVDWSLLTGSPAPTGTVRALNSLGQGCTAQPLTGSCAVPIPAAGPQTITVTYSGDVNYASASQPVNGSAVACHLFSIDASPVGWGSFDVFPAADCNGGRGYADGDYVVVQPLPGAHHHFAGFDGYPASVTSLAFSITQDTFLTGRFDYLCDTVTVEYVPQANWFPSTNPDCGPITQDPSSHAVFLPYHDGESVTLVGEAVTYTGQGLFSVTGWRVLYGSAPEGTASSYTFTVTPYLDLRPVLTRPCYRMAPAFSDPAGGTVSSYAAGLGPSCTLPDGAPGYYYGTDVYVRVTPTITQQSLAFGRVALQHPTYLTTGVTLRGTDAGAGLTSLGFGLYHVVVHGDNTVAVAVAACHRVDATIEPQDPVRVGRTFEIAGRVSVAGTPCQDSSGNPSTDWFAGPATVTATASPGLQFYTWHGDTASGLNPALSPAGGDSTITVDGTSDHSLAATFGLPSSCYPVSLEIGALAPTAAALHAGWGGAVPTSPYGSLRVSASTPEGGSGHGYCPPDLYEAGSLVTVSLTPALPGEFTGFMSRWIRYNPDGTPNAVQAIVNGPLDYDGSQLTGDAIGQSHDQLTYILPAAGGGASIVAQAWFCFPVDVTQYATSPNGTPFDPPDAMVGIDSASTGNACPISPFAYYPGTTVSVTEAPSPGYTFSGWSGSAAGTSAHLSRTVDQPLEFDAAFAGACYQLSVDDTYSSSGPDPSDALRSDQPNCPGYGSSQGMYLAGTVVVLQAADHGSQEPFEGWQGVDSASGSLAFVTMTGPKTVHAYYNNDLSHPTASASAFGTYMSAVGKATLGVLADALSQYVVNFTSAGLVGLAGTIGTALGSIGVPGASQLGQIMGSLSKVITGPLDCLGTWGLSPGSGNAVGNGVTAGGGYAKSGAGAANTAVKTVEGQGPLGWLTQKMSSDLRDYASENADQLTDAEKTTYALKWVAIGIQLSGQLMNASVNADWSLSSFENQMNSCLAQKGGNLAGSITG